ncbi:hypothetical protein [Deinococcus sp. 12RED42]|uniref:hypothetical protein n=1 Tax=Deinococcus sp. 12RED42 TaxID=2745872 RepID=UPI001E52FE41|nr:hypothetical protein [Deinococcus sp. 12RED42]MCD0164780.1 hypothetical protein [Deinococcus sp. 12RED42]
METDSRHKAFRPVPLEEQSLLHAASTWQACRFLDGLAARLLDETFPGWSDHAEPATRLNWTAMCRDLLIDTGDNVELIWRTLEAGASTELSVRPLPTHNELVLSLHGADGHPRVQLHLLEVVMQELQRPRVLGKGKAAKPFTLLEVLREEYNESESDYGSLSRQGIGEISQILSMAWVPNLRASLQQPGTTRVPSVD